MTLSLPLRTIVVTTLGLSALSLAAMVACSSSTSSDAPKEDASTDASNQTPNDSGIDAETQGGTGGPYLLLYSGRFNNIDLRIVTATRASNGGMTSYQTLIGSSEAPYFSGVVSDNKSDAFVAIGRWNNGTKTGPFYDDGGAVALEGNSSQHYALSLQPTTLPSTGSATYTLTSATAVSVEDPTVALGEVTSASLKVNFAGEGTRVGFDMSIFSAGVSFTVQGNGGASTPGDAGNLFAPNPSDAGFMSASTPAIVSNCEADGGACSSSNVYIGFAGPNAERVTMAYVFGPSGVSTARRHGVAYFTKQ